MNNYWGFFSGRIRTLVAMATYSSHRLMGKEKIDIFLSQWGYLEILLQKFLLSRPLRLITLLSKLLNLISYPGGKEKRVDFRKI